MLRKLLKYDILEMSKLFGPLYLCSFVVGIVSSFMYRISLDGISALGMIMFFMSFNAAWILSIVFPIIRFKNSMLGREGYLTNVLPVKTSDNIISKTLSAVFWQVLSGAFLLVVFIIHNFINYGNIEMIETLISVLKTPFLIFNTNLSTAVEIIIYTLLMILVAFVAMTGLNLMVFTSIAIGHFANTKKVLKSTGVFIGIYVVSQIINYELLRLYMKFEKFVECNWLDPKASEYGLPLIVLLSLFVLYLGYSIVYLIITNYFMTKKLNIE